jgi:hypothetical protein
LEALKFNAEFKYKFVNKDDIVVKYERNMVRFTISEKAQDRSFGEIIDLDETKYNAVEV